MFQDIAPHQFHNEFAHREPVDTDYIIQGRDGAVLLSGAEDTWDVPTYAAFCQCYPIHAQDLVYLFSVDQHAFYLHSHPLEEAGGLAYQNIRFFRNKRPEWLAFAGATAVHLASFYERHRFCGRCAALMAHHEKERALCCPVCGDIVYPSISPAVIVGIVDGDKILLTVYANAPYKKHALVAGFTEIGETLEDTVRREVLEEVGLRVQNIRYYKSQPWAFSASILMGFFADLEGSSEVCLDRSELREATWYTREDLPRDDNVLSLTWEMIETFRAGSV